MEKLRCPICGMELQQTNFGNYLCSNHGIVYINPENEKSDSEANYIG